MGRFSAFCLGSLAYSLSMAELVIKTPHSFWIRIARDGSPRHAGSIWAAQHARKGDRGGIKPGQCHATARVSKTAPGGSQEEAAPTAKGSELPGLLLAVLLLGLGQTPAAGAVPRHPRHHRLRKFRFVGASAVPFGGLQKATAPQRTARAMLRVLEGQ